jgi:hypothetical protein
VTRSTGALLALLISGAQGSAACLSYAEPAMLEGRLVRRVFPGPPNYESIARGDRREVALILQLESPACVDADPADSSGFSPAIGRVSEIQLVAAGAGPKPAPGARVRVTGHLFGAHTGHHRTPVLLGDITLRAINAPAGRGVP